MYRMQKIQWFWDYGSRGDTEKPADLHATLPKNETLSVWYLLLHCPLLSVCFNLSLMDSYIAQYEQIIHRSNNVYFSDTLLTELKHKTINLCTFISWETEILFALKQRETLPFK